MDDLSFYILIVRHGIFSVMSLIFLLIGIAFILPAIQGAIFKQERPKWLWYAGVVGVIIAIILFAIMQSEEMTMNVWFWAK